MMRVLGRTLVRVSSVVVIVSLLLGGRTQASRYTRAVTVEDPASPSASNLKHPLTSPAPLSPQADFGIPFISEVSPVSVPGSPAWMEIGLQVNTSYLPVVAKAVSGMAQASTIGGAYLDAASALPGFSLTGWQVSNEHGSNYAIPAALPPLPAYAKLVLVFDGQGPAADDYNFSDGIATLHSPPGMVNIFDQAGDQVSLYRSATHTAATVADFVAWGQPTGSAEANAVAAGLWTTDAFLSFEPGFGAGGLTSPNQPGQSFGVWQNSKAGNLTDWASYTAGQSSRGLRNLPPAPMGSTVADGAVIAGETFGLAWTGVPGALGYEFELATNPAFTTPLVSLMTDYPGWASPTPMPDGVYYWRVRALTSKGSSLFLGPYKVTSKRLDSLSQASTNQPSPSAPSRSPCSPTLSITFNVRTPRCST